MIDSEALAAFILREAGVADGRVHSSIPTTPVFPLVTLHRAGGIPSNRRRLDRANIQVDCWGTNKSEARDLADAAREALMEAEGSSFSMEDGSPVDGVLTGVQDTLGLTWLPDPRTAKDRYFFQVFLYTHE